MSEITHLNDLEYNDADEKKIKVHLHDGRMYSQVRDDATGDFNTPRAIQNKDIVLIKDMYGGNGNDRNLCLKFQLDFADAQAHQFSSQFKQELYNIITNQAYDESVVAEMIVDSSGSGINGVSLIYTVAYDPNNEAALKTGEATSLLTTLRNSANLQAIFTDNVSAPFNTNVTLHTSDPIAMIVHKNVPASVLKVNVADIGNGTDTQIGVVLVGNWDHWAVKYDTNSVIQTDNDYIRVKDGTLIHTYTGVNKSELTKVYITVFDRDYQPLYTYENGAPFDNTAIIRHSIKTNYY
jgi:hypothetical protein